MTKKERAEKRFKSLNEATLRVLKAAGKARREQEEKENKKK